MSCLFEKKETLDIAFVVVYNIMTPYTQNILFPFSLFSAVFLVPLFPPIVYHPPLLTIFTCYCFQKKSILGRAKKDEE